MNTRTRKTKTSDPASKTHVRPKSKTIGAAADFLTRFRLADPQWNANEIITAVEHYASLGIGYVVFPELCITGAACGDLFQLNLLLDAAQKALKHILVKTKALPVSFVVSLPERFAPGLFAVSLCIREGKIIARNRKPLSAPPTVFAPITLISTREKRNPDRLILCPSAVPSALMGPNDLAEFALQSASDEKTSFVMGTPRFGESVTDAFYGMPWDGSILVEKGRLIASESSQPQAFESVAFSSAFKPAPEQPLLTYTESNSKLLALRRDPMPFIPNTKKETNWISATMIQALAHRMKSAHADKLIIGVSGGLDSTLALITAHEACALLKLPSNNVIAVSMPGFGTTARTKNNAAVLAGLLGCDCRSIDIRNACLQHFADIGHDSNVADVVFENAQARERTQILMDLANANNALVVGTGDLSEIALGWCTYNGDHMSMYAVNSGVPKTLVRHLVDAYALDHGGETASVLRDILNTPVSPELLPAGENGESGHKTEQILGPYELHDFYLFHLLKFNESPREIFLRAKKVFDGQYPADEIRRTLELFLRRFFTQQFKRSCSPDGPAVCSISLSPRSGWRVPSDASPSLWLGDLR